MGVKDLWTLLGPIGRRVSMESLERKTLAIDVSIWITQFIKAMRDDEGKMLKNAHLIGMLRRILKLLYYRINPVFVFDGATPKLKERTIQLRRNKRKSTEDKQQKNLNKLYMSMLKTEILQAELAKREGRTIASPDMGIGAGASATSSSGAETRVEGFVPFDPTITFGSSPAAASAPESAMRSSNTTTPSSAASSTRRAGASHGATASASATATATHSSSATRGINNTSDRELDWVDASDDELPAKILSDDENDEAMEVDGFEGGGSFWSRRAGGGSFNNRDTGMRYQVPADGNFDVETMAALDVYKRKDIAEDLRRQLVSLFSFSTLFFHICFFTVVV